MYGNPFFAKLDFTASNGKIKRVILVFSCVPKPEMGLMDTLCMNNGRNGLSLLLSYPT